MTANPRPRKRRALPKREPLPFTEQLKQNPVSAGLIALSGIALLGFLLGVLFESRVGTTVYFLTVYLRLPIVAVLLLGAFVDKSRWWLGAAAFAYLSCFIAPAFLMAFLRVP